MGGDFRLRFYSLVGLRVSFIVFFQSVNVCCHPINAFFCIQNTTVSIVLCQECNYIANFIFLLVVIEGGLGLIFNDVCFQ